MTQRILSRLGIRTLILIAFMLGPIPAFVRELHAGPQRRPQKSRAQKPKVPPKPKVDYTKFSHTTHAVTQKLACNSCHKVPSKNWKEFRKGDAAFPDVTDFPEHASCL
ncbi:MAG: hypothetical protein ACXW3C_02955, partial [Pyrinomonadaceae bacterium]